MPPLPPCAAAYSAPRESDPRRAPPDPILTIPAAHPLPSVLSLKFDRTDNEAINASFVVPAQAGIHLYPFTSRPDNVTNAEAKHSGGATKLDYGRCRKSVGKCCLSVGRVSAPSVEEALPSAEKWPELAQAEMLGLHSSKAVAVIDQALDGDISPVKLRAALGAINAALKVRFGLNVERRLNRIDDALSMLRRESAGPRP